MAAERMSAAVETLNLGAVWALKISRARQLFASTLKTSYIVFCAGTRRAGVTNSATIAVGNGGNLDGSVRSGNTRGKLRGRFSSTLMTTAFSGSAAGFRGNSLVPAREGG
jgi:hypothetical protein